MIVFSPSALAASNRWQALNEHETSAVRPYQDRRLQTLVKHARGDFVHAPLIKGGAPFDWHVDVCDRNGLALHRCRLHIIHRWHISRALLFFGCSPLNF